MAIYLLRRLGLAVITLFLLSMIIFFAGQVLPGDPARSILGPLSAESAVRALDHQLGVDRPLATQYWSWITGLLHGNMGESYQYQSAVAPLLRAALVNSAKLAALALIVIIPLGILGGVVAALYAGRPVDRIISLTGSSAATVPEFVSGIVVIVIAVLIIFTASIAWFVRGRRENVHESVQEGGEGFRPGEWNKKP